MTWRQRRGSPLVSAQDVERPWLSDSKDSGSFGTLRFNLPEDGKFALLAPTSPDLWWKPAGVKLC